MSNQSVQSTSATRMFLTRANRIVVKVGTRVLVNNNGRPNQRRIANIVAQLIALQKMGKEVVLVSSGTIGAGMQALGMKTRPSAIADLQMAAAVGQTRLLDCYSRYFTKGRCCISQVLLTHADLKHRGRHLNARNTMLNLLRHRVIPIVNENDVVSVDEIRFGDNDVLSALVSSLIDADVLILLTTPDGLRKQIGKSRTERVPYIEKITPSVFKLATQKIDSLSTGGMVSKLKAVQTANKMGALAVIASGLQRTVVQRIMSGEDVGTLIGNKDDQSYLTKRKCWISYFHHPQGKLVLDEGACEAVMHGGRSLLPIGIKKVIGAFPVGAQVSLMSPKNQLIGYGLVEYSHSQIDKIKRHHSNEIAHILQMQGPSVVVHRDNMGILSRTATD